MQHGRETAVAGPPICLRHVPDGDGAVTRSSEDRPIFPWVRGRERSRKGIQWASESLEILREGRK
jgi:hypothetical protein